LFESNGDSPGDVIETDDALSVVSWRVTPRIVELARAPQQLEIVLGTRERLVVDMLRFEPRDGFYLADEPDDYIVDEDPSRVSYYWYGSAGTTLVFVTVHRGIVNGTVYARDHRYTLTSTDGIHVFRDVDMRVLNSGVCRNAEIARLTRERLGANPSLSNPALAATVRSPVPWWPYVVPKLVPAVNKRMVAAIAKPKYGLPLSIKFYFTVEAARFFDVNYVPGSSPVPTALRGRVDHYLDEFNQVLRNSGGLSHYAASLAAEPVLLTDLMGDPIRETPIASWPPGARFSEYVFQAAIADYQQGALVSPPRGRVGSDADVALLLVRDSGGPPPAQVLYGAAYTQRPNCLEGQIIPPWSLCGVGADAYRGYAFAAISIDPNTAALTFSHELGHMHGNDHDFPNRNPAIDTFGHSFAHSFGYRVSTTRDVMADPPCGFPNLPDSCPRSMQFSNPETTFLNAPSVVAGIPGGRSCPTWGVSCLPTAHAALTVAKLAFGTADIYPAPSVIEAPIFWDGLEF
jgi:hypothetical protein